MKFIDLINESDHDKQIKKGKTVYKALRKGTIGGKDPEEPHFKYELSDDFSVDTNNAGILIFTEKVKIKELNRGCNLHSTGYMVDLIRKRFQHFGITLTNPYIDYDTESWEGPINENVRYFKKKEPSEEKRVKTIFKALKKGVLKINHPKTDEIIKFSYYINDNVFYRWEYYMHDTYITIITNNRPGEGVTINVDNQETLDLFTKDIDIMSKNPMGIYIKEMIRDKIRARFFKFDTSIHVNDSGIKFVLDEPTEPISEDVEVLKPNTLTGKQINKVKLIYKTFKKGHFRYDEHSTYGYVLPDDYYIFSDVDDDVCVQLTNKEGQNIKMFSRVLMSHLRDNITIPIQKEHTGLQGWIKERIAEKFIGFNIKFIF